MSSLSRSIVVTVDDVGVGFLARFRVGCGVLGRIAIPVRGVINDSRAVSDVSLGLSEERS